MTTYVNFTPSQVTAFQFQATLDGDVYNVQVTWSLFGNHFYINVYALDGTLVVCKSLIGSPTGVQVQSLDWALPGIVTAITVDPHGYKIGTIVALTISNAAPDGYNGQVLATIQDELTFTFPLATDPGSATAFGAVTYDIDLVAGLFDTSTLVFRQESQQFEVSP